MPDEKKLVKTTARLLAYKKALLAEIEELEQTKEVLQIKQQLTKEQASILNVYAAIFARLKKTIRDNEKVRDDLENRVKALRDTLATASDGEVELQGRVKSLRKEIERLEARIRFLNKVRSEIERECV